MKYYIQIYIIYQTFMSLNLTSDNDRVYDKEAEDNYYEGEYPNQNELAGNIVQTFLDLFLYFINIEFNLLKCRFQILTYQIQIIV